MKQLWFDILNPAEMLTYDPQRSKGKRKGAGCRGCPLEGDSVCLKDLDAVEGRKAMLWLEEPSRAEEDNESPLAGKAGVWFRREAAKFGLKVDDFDIQFSVRCRSGNGAPTDKVREHCNHFNQQALALNGGRAQVHIFLGRMPAQMVLGREFRRDVPVFWSETLQAMCFCLDSPSYFQRPSVPDWRLEEFRTRLEAAAWYVQHSGRWSFLQSCDFKGLTKVAAIRKYLNKLRAQGKSVAVDIEEGKVGGKDRVLCIGFSNEPRVARVVILDHPEVKRTKLERLAIIELLREFMEDGSVKKVLQYGCYDGDRLKELLGFGIKGYDFDTTYAHYLRYTFLKSHGLEAIAASHHPLYAGYKDLVRPFVKATGNYADIPLETMILYNGADASLTKEIEQTLAPQISLPLLKIYTQTGITLHRMQGRGPKLDPQYFKEVNALIPNRLLRIESKLRSLADDPGLNLNTPAKVAEVIYDKLGLPDISEKRSTKESVLEMLAAETKHPFPKGLMEYRGLAKMVSTYLTGYKTSADMNGGELRTRWFLTGAVTGRLRSGGTREGIKGVINMQNLHGSPFLQNLLVSDLCWREALAFCEMVAKVQGGKKPPPIPDEVLDLDVFLALDYSQIEIRMLAECSGDPLLIQQFQEGVDIHCAVGNTLNPEWSLEFIKKDKPTRTFIKNCHFGMVYGLDELGLFYYLKAKNVKTTEKKVAKFHRAYFKKYAGVARFIESSRAFAVEHGYAETMFGFRRLVGNEADEDRNTNPENQAVNSPIQGSAHTLLLAAMALLTAKPKTYALLQEPLMEVHDALVFKVKLRDLPAAYALAKQLLEKDAPAYIHKLFGIKLRVPLLAEASAGFRYGTMVETDVTDLHGFLREWYAKNQKIEADVTANYRSAA